MAAATAMDRNPAMGRFHQRLTDADRVTGVALPPDGRGWSVMPPVEKLWRNYREAEDMT